MADIVVYEDSPLAQYLQEIQGEQHGADLKHSMVPVHDPGPPPEFIGLRLAHNAFGMLTDLVEYLSHTFSPSASDSEDAEFEERFKYFICTSPFLNKSVALHSHGERGRRTDAPMTIEYASKFSPGRLGYMLGFGTVAALVARSVLARTRVGRLPLVRPLLGRSVAVSLALASSAWMLRILQRRNIQATQNQALRSLQLLVNQCQALDAKVNRAIMVIQEIELVSRGYRLSTPLAPISRIEQASKTRRCNMVRAQLVAALVKSGALFQKSTETLQSHIDHKRLSTLLDMYHITPSSRPSSPPGMHGSTATASTAAPLFAAHDNDLPTMTTSPTSETHSPPWPSSQTQHVRQNSTSKRRSHTLTGGSCRNSRPSSYHDPSHPHPTQAEHHARPATATGRRSAIRRHHTSWSASEGEESDSGSFTVSVSPRSSTYSHMDNSSPTLTNAPEMTSLERLRKNFQRMHGHRREFLCELLSIRRRSRQGRHGLNALRDYDQNWAVVRDVLQEGVAGIESVVDELSKVLDAELYTLPRIDTQSSNSGNALEDTQLQPFVQRLALMEQHVRGVQAKLFICNEDIKEAIRLEPSNTEKRRLLELQFDSISQDISMMATEWQFGKTALVQVFEPSTARSSTFGHGSTLLDENDELDYDDDQAQQGDQGLGPIVDALEQMEDQQRLMDLAATREETWEASTESTSMVDDSTARAGPKMTRAERIQHQKKLRAEEESKKERIFDSSKMVHELKDVLGRRRHLRENDDDDEEFQQQQQHHQQRTAHLANSMSLPYIPTGSYLAPAPTEPRMLSEELPIEHISPFSLSEQAFSQDLNLFTSATTVEEEQSFVEITGVGEAEDVEGQEQQD